MKVAIAIIAALAITISSVSAFAPLSAASRSPRRTAVFSSEPETEDEEGLDLNLEEMFDMFDAADKEESFDDAIKKVKKD
ncbi:hypothetical protein IV203_022335 [Nitzschia inconspicua]|uniref:Uncharacterized protein n=1 Tax=Nitzschia inconspicua TaxID=303405 RepID=A0A9K3KIG3_9STRA|nr:hypothetical protein IV203_022335 [Nitzschia inconspicua]